MRSAIALCLLVTGCAMTPEFRAETHCAARLTIPQTMDEARRDELADCMAELGWARKPGGRWKRTTDAERAAEVDDVVESEP